MVTGKLAFVFAAYVITGLVLAGLVAWVLVDRAAQRAKLKRLEEAGISRAKLEN